MLDRESTGDVGLSERPKRDEREPEPPSGATKLDLHDVVETALAEALMLAARAGRWEIVEQIARELGPANRKIDRSAVRSRRMGIDRIASA